MSRQASPTRDLEIVPLSSCMQHGFVANCRGGMSGFGSLIFRFTTKSTGGFRDFCIDGVPSEMICCPAFIDEWQFVRLVGGCREDLGNDGVNSSAHAPATGFGNAMSGINKPARGD